MDLQRLRPERTDPSFEHGVETVRSVVEGAGHSGDGAVVQVIAVHR